MLPIQQLMESLHTNINPQRPYLQDFYLLNPKLLVCNFQQVASEGLTRGELSNSVSNEMYIHFN